MRKGFFMGTLGVGDGADVLSYLVCLLAEFGSCPIFQEPSPVICRGFDTARQTSLCVGGLQRVSRALGARGMAYGAWDSGRESGLGISTAGSERDPRAPDTTPSVIWRWGPPGGGAGLLEELGGEFGEVTAPDGPAMVAFGEVPFVAEMVGFELLDELEVTLEEEVFLAAGDPEEGEATVDTAGVGEGVGEGVGARGGGAEAGDPGEAVGVVETDTEGLFAAHAQAGEGAVAGAGFGAVVGFDERDDGFEQVAFEAGGVVFAGGQGFAGGGGMAVHHDHDHGAGAAGGDEVVEDPVGFTVDDPGGLVIAGSVLEVEHGVGDAVAPGVAGRGIDPEIAQATQGWGEVGVLVDGAVGDVLEVVWEGRGPGQVEDAGARFAHGFDGGVGGIEQGDAIDDEAVLPDTRVDGAGGQRPDSVGVAVEGQALVGPLTGEGDLGGFWSAEAERHLAIGGDFGGAQRGWAVRGAGGFGGGAWGRGEAERKGKGESEEGEAWVVVGGHGGGWKGGI